MGRERFCRVCKGWHDLDQPWPSECFKEPVGQRSGIPTPFVVSDTMDPVQSQLDGKMYTSKSALRATYKAAGVIEVGNDAQRLKPKERKRSSKQEIRDSLKTAKEKVAARL